MRRAVVVLLWFMSKAFGSSSDRASASRMAAAAAAAATTGVCTATAAARTAGLRPRARLRSCCLVTVLAPWLWAWARLWSATAARRRYGKSRGRRPGWTWRCDRWNHPLRQVRSPVSPEGTTGGPPSRSTRRPGGVYQPRRRPPNPRARRLTPTREPPATGAATTTNPLRHPTSGGRGIKGAQATGVGVPNRRPTPVPRPTGAVMPDNLPTPAPRPTGAVTPASPTTEAQRTGGGTTLPARRTTIRVEAGKSRLHELVEGGSSSARARPALAAHLAFTGLTPGGPTSRGMGVRKACAFGPVGAGSWRRL